MEGREGGGGERQKRGGGGKGHRGPAMGAKATQAKRPHNAKHTTDKPPRPRAPPEPSRSPYLPHEQGAPPPEGREKGSGGLDRPPGSQPPSDGPSERKTNTRRQIYIYIYIKLNKYKQPTIPTTPPRATPGVFYDATGYAPT